MADDGDKATRESECWTSIPDAFARHVRCRPDALAVEAQGERRSYAELSARIDLFAGRLAQHLPPDGERLVGVCLARDVDLPAWLLAVLKVGAAYLPIDPTMPAARLTPMLEDAQPALVVVSRVHAAVVAGIATPVIVAEDEATAPPAPICAILPGDLAYVIFTSGSTGRPKGVEIEHRSLAALMATMAVSPGFMAGERMLALTRISFDLSVPDMFLPFFVGGSLAIVDLETAADPERLGLAFDAYRPDLAQATPSTWRALLEAGWRGLPSLRILAGGEAMTRALADRLLPCCWELWNIYGPTEATVWSTACLVLPGTDPVPIGRALAGVAVHVVDGTTAPVPHGVVGEIAVGGTGVARGYRARPDLTAERFVTGPAGTRLYRTGDLGRFDADGILHCLGRLDDQVKLRGFRIELGDVEAALAAHPAVAWSAARLWTDATGEPVLAGHVVLRRGERSSVRAIRAFLATCIAPYMIPDRIVIADAMPLTPNGKVDRAALADPFAALAPTAAPVDARVKTRLAAIWSELLGVGSVDDDHDFFDLGGYSLMTVRLTRRIEAAFGVRLELVEMMRHSTLGAMATRIERGAARPDDAAPSLMLLNEAGARAPLYWLDAGPLMRTMVRHLSPDQPAFALNLDSADEAALGPGAVSIPAIATRLKARLRAAQPDGPYYLGGWCRWGIVAWELARQLCDDGATVGLLVLLDADRPGRPPSRGLRSRMTAWFRPPGPARPESVSQRVEVATWSYIAQPYAGDVVLLRPLTATGDAGWSPLVRGTLDIAHTPGDHETMVRGAHAAVLAERMDHALQVAQRVIAPVVEHRQAARAMTA